MNRIRIVVFSVIFLVLYVMVFSSCRHSKMATCQSNNYHVSTKIKKPKSDPLRIHEPKYRPVKKNYVIKNGSSY
jgi:hypothetical protein